MSEKSSISESFYKQITTIGTIVVTSVFGFQYLENTVKNTVESSIQPLTKRVESIEKKIEDAENILAMNTQHIQAVSVSLNNFLEYYNKYYHKEFIRPVDISYSSITQDKKRK